jgi:hypothetical protein
VEARQIHFLQRTLTVPISVDGFARFTFDELCGQVDCVYW